MRTIKLHEWMFLIFLGIFGALLWQNFFLPRYEQIDLSVNRAQAIQIAKEYLKTKNGIDPDQYMHGCVFSVDNPTDRYLQKTLGMEGAKKFIKEHDFELFYWTVRFFKEKTKEEYSMDIGSSNGKVMRYNHAIEETEARPDQGKDVSRAKAFAYLRDAFGLDEQQYTIHSENAVKFDKRQDYSFSWEHKQVLIPWDAGLGGGQAKLVSTAVVSGDEVLMFSRQDLDIPEGFNRHVESLKQTGQNLIMLFRIVYLALLTLAIMLVVNRKQHIVPRVVKKFYVAAAVLIFIFMVIDFFNSYQQLLYQYPTTQSFGNYVMRELVQALISPIFIVLGIILPALAGEALRYEVAPKEKNAGFLSNIQSSFMTMTVGKQIVVGYIAALFTVGVQGLIFHWGYTFWGVWDEFSWVTQSTTNLIPAFTAILIGLHASFAEEVMFRLFAINLLRRYGVGIIAAVIISSIVWGFGHTGYAIYPMWFRGIEVSILGLILACFYLRYGLLTTIVAHYLMNAFLNVLPYMLKPAFTFDFAMSLAAVLLPLGWAAIAFFMRRSEEERPLTVRMTPQQEFNYTLLRDIKCGKIPHDMDRLKRDLLKHGWDPAVVARVFDQ